MLRGLGAAIALPWLEAMTPDVPAARVKATGRPADGVPVSPARRRDDRLEGRHRRRPDMS